MRVLMLSAEAHPYAKTGGLGDVLAALPRALAAIGIDVTVCLPGYRAALATAGSLEPIGRVHVPVSSRMEPAEILRVTDARLPTVLVRADRYFDREHVYGPPDAPYPDNAERFVFLCRAVLEWLRDVTPRPDVLHVHDWPTALAPAFLRATAALYPTLAQLRSVLTIHNLAYQGRFWRFDWHLLNLDPRFFSPEFLEFYGDINFLKAGLVFADGITTVSPRYAAEIQTSALGEGLDGVLRSRAGRLRGILNGVDYREWSPATDRHLPARYDATDMAGKARCKTALQTDLDLVANARAPLLAVVTRFAHQKGVDLMAEVLPAVLRATDAQVAILGDGEPAYEAPLRDLAAAHPGRVGLRIGFDEGLAHRIEAGADVFLMPSRFEPCGLSQLYSLRYGTIPVVHATGGLDDTVIEFDYSTGVGTGFKFAPHTADAFLAAVRRALSMHREPALWSRLVANAMAQDFSWERSAREYARLYAALPPPLPVDLR